MISTKMASDRVENLPKYGSGGQIQWYLRTLRWYPSTLQLLSPVHRSFPILRVHVVTGFGYVLKLGYATFDEYVATLCSDQLSLSLWLLGPRALGA